MIVGAWKNIWGYLLRWPSTIIPEPGPFITTPPRGGGGFRPPTVKKAADWKMVLSDQTPFETLGKSLIIRRSMGGVLGCQLACTPFYSLTLRLWKGSAICPMPPIGRLAAPVAMRNSPGWWEWRGRPPRDAITRPSGRWQCPSSSASGNLTRGVPIRRGTGRPNGEGGLQSVYKGVYKGGFVNPILHLDVQGPC